MRVKARLLLLLLALVCVFGLSGVTVSEAYSGGNAIGSLGSGTGSTDSVGAWGFRIIPVKHDLLYQDRPKKAGYGDVDRDAIYCASAGITDDANNLQGVSRSSLDSATNGVIIVMGVANGSSVPTGENANHLAVEKDSETVFLPPISVVMNDDYVWQDPKDGSIHSSAKSGCDKRLLADALLYNPVAEDYQAVTSTIDELRKFVQVDTDTHPDSSRVFKLSNMGIENANQYRKSIDDYSFYEVAKGGEWVEKSSSGTYHYVVADKTVGTALQRFLVPAKLAGNRNYDSTRDEFVKAKYAAKKFQNWTFYAKNGRMFFSKAYAYATYSRIAHKESDRTNLRKNLVAAMTTYSTDSGLGDLSSITDSWQLYVEPVVMFDNKSHVWMSYQTAARIRSKNYSLATVRFGTNIDSLEELQNDSVLSDNIKKNGIKNGSDIIPWTKTNSNKLGVMLMQGKSTGAKQNNYSFLLNSVAQSKTGVSVDTDKNLIAKRITNTALPINFGRLLNTFQNSMSGLYLRMSYTGGYLTGSGAGDSPGTRSRDLVGTDGSILTRQIDGYAKLQYKSDGPNPFSFNDGGRKYYPFDGLYFQVNNSKNGNHSSQISGAVTGGPGNVTLLTSFASTVEFDTNANDCLSLWKLLEVDPGYRYRQFSDVLADWSTRTAFAATGAWSQGGYYTLGGLYKPGKHDDEFSEASPKHLAVNVAVKINDPTKDSSGQKVSIGYVSSGDAYTGDYTKQDDGSLEHNDIGDGKPLTSLIANTSMLLDYNRVMKGNGTFLQQMKKHFVQKNAKDSPTSWGLTATDWSGQSHERATKASPITLDKLMWTPDEEYTKTWNKAVSKYGRLFSANIFSVAKAIGYQRARYIKGSDETSTRTDNQYVTWSTVSTGNVYNRLLGYTDGFYDADHPMFAYWVGTTAINADCYGDGTEADTALKFKDSSNAPEGYVTYQKATDGITKAFTDSTLMYSPSEMTVGANSTNVSLRFGKHFSPKLKLGGTAVQSAGYALTDKTDLNNLVKDGVAYYLSYKPDEFIAKPNKSKPVMYDYSIARVPVGTDYKAGEMPGQYVGYSLLATANNISMVNAAYRPLDYVSYNSTVSAKKRVHDVNGNDPFRIDFYTKQVVPTAKKVTLTVPQSLTQGEDPEETEGTNTENNDGAEGSGIPELVWTSPVKVGLGDTSAGEKQVTVPLETFAPEGENSNLVIPPSATQVPDDGSNDDTDIEEASATVTAYMDTARDDDLTKVDTRFGKGQKTARFRIVGEPTVVGRRAKATKVDNLHTHYPVQYRMGIAVELYAQLPKVSSWYTSLTMEFDDQLEKPPVFLLPTDSRYVDDKLNERSNLASSKGVTDKTSITYPSEGASSVRGAASDDLKSPYSYYKTGQTEANGGWDDSAKNFKTYEYSVESHADMSIFYQNSTDDNTAYCYVFGVNNASSKLNTDLNYMADGKQNYAWCADANGGHAASNLSATGEGIVRKDLDKNGEIPSITDYANCMIKILFKSAPTMGVDYFVNPITADTPIALGAFGNKTDNPTKLAGATLYVLKISTPKSITAESSINLQDFQLNHWYSETFFTENLTAGDGGHNLSITKAKMDSTESEGTETKKGVKFVSNDRNYMFVNPDNAIGGSLIRSSVLKPIPIAEDKRYVIVCRKWEDIKTEGENGTKVKSAVPIPKLTGNIIMYPNQPEPNGWTDGGTIDAAQWNKTDVAMALRQGVLSKTPTRTYTWDFSNAPGAWNESWSKGDNSYSHYYSSWGGENPGWSSSTSRTNSPLSPYYVKAIQGDESGTGRYSHSDGSKKSETSTYSAKGSKANAKLYWWGYKEMQKTAEYRIFEVRPSNGQSFGSVPTSDSVNGGYQVGLDISNRILAGWTAHTNSDGTSIKSYADGYRAALYPGSEWKVHYNDGHAGYPGQTSNPTDDLRPGFDGSKSANTFWAFNLNRANFGDYRTISAISNNMTGRAETVIYATNYLGNYFGLGTKKSGSGTVHTPSLNGDTSLGTVAATGDEHQNYTNTITPNGYSPHVDDDPVVHSAKYDSSTDYLGVTPKGSVDPYKEAGKATVEYQAQTAANVSADTDGGKTVTSIIQTNAKQEFTKYLSETADPNNGDYRDGGVLKASGKVRNSLAYVHYGLGDTIYYSTRWQDSSALLDLSSGTYSYSDEHRTNPAVETEGTITVSYQDWWYDYVNESYVEHYRSWSDNSDSARDTPRKGNCPYPSDPDEGDDAHYDYWYTDGSGYLSSIYKSGAPWTRTYTFVYATLADRRPLKVKMLNAWNVYPNKIMQSDDMTDYFPCYGIQNGLFEKVYKYQTSNDLTGISNLHYTDGKPEHSSYYKNPKYSEDTSTKPSKYPLNDNWSESNNNSTIGFNKGIRNTGTYDTVLKGETGRSVDNIMTAGKTATSTLTNKASDDDSTVLYRMAVVNPNSGVYHTEDADGSYTALTSGMLRFRPEVRMQVAVPRYNSNTALTTRTTDTLNGYTIQSVYTMGEVLRSLKTSAMYIVKLTNDNPGELVTGTVYSDTMGSDTEAADVAGTDPVIYGGSDVSLIVDSSKIKLNIIGYALDLVDEEDGRVKLGTGGPVAETKNLVVDSKTAAGGNTKTQMVNYIRSDQFKTGIGSFAKSFGTYSDVVRSVTYKDSHTGKYPNFKSDGTITESALVKNAWGNGTALGAHGTRTASEENFKHFANSVLNSVTADIALKVPKRGTDAGKNNVYCNFNVSSSKMTSDESAASNIAFNIRIRSGRLLTGDIAVQNAYPQYFMYEAESFNDKQTGHGGGGMDYLLDCIAVDYGYTKQSTYNGNDSAGRVKAAKLFINSDMGTSILRAIESNWGAYGNRTNIKVENAGSSVVKPFNNARSGAYGSTDFKTSSASSTYSGEPMTSLWGIKGGKTLADLYDPTTGLVMTRTASSLSKVTESEDKHWYDEEVYTFVVRRYAMTAAQIDNITLVDKIDYEVARDEGDLAGQNGTSRGNINKDYDGKTAQWYLTLYYKDPIQFSACTSVYNPGEDGALTPTVRSKNFAEQGNVLLENIYIKGADFQVPDETTDAIVR